MERNAAQNSDRYFQKSNWHYEHSFRLNKGRAKGSRRLSEIKQAARRKFVREIIRKFDDETGLLEFGRDPFGKRIINISSFTLSPSFSLIEIDDIQCDEDAKFSLFANDILQCHSHEK
ncbi:hypothetical protein V6N13_125088 [Hibiscus sabdariffa]|uniref:Uncharacterized protein n=1 Tax=Hibiscus sabdariffa TaxID=183260 RepID=A0ABR2U5I0_9ROSI